MLSLPSFTDKCRVGQGVKTPPFHGGITGSNPVRGTKSLSAMEGFLILSMSPKQNMAYYSTDNKEFTR